jgi:tetratricopeptide (TPR) repeat protein
MVKLRFWKILFYLMLLMAILPWVYAQQSGGNSGNTGSTGTDTSRKESANTPATPPTVPQNQDFLTPPRDLNPQVFITGSVIQEDGTPPPNGAVIEMDCGSTKTREAMVSPNGHFSFQIGDNALAGQIMPDASEGYEERFRRNESGVTPTGLRDISRRSALFSHASLAGCDLRAQIHGFISSTSRIEGTSFTRFIDSGLIVVYPIERVKGTTVSITNLLAPKAARKALERGKKEFKKNRFDESESLYRSAIDQYKNYGEAWFQLGQLYQKQQRNDDARKAFHKAIEADAYFVSPYLSLAWLESGEKKWQEVTDHTDRVLALDPMSFPDAYYLNALANYNLNNLDLAVQRAHQGLRSGPAREFPQVYLILAQVAARKNDNAAAIEGLRNYIKYAPDAVDADQVRSQLQETLAKSAY